MRKYGRVDRAVKHWIIAAKQGEDNSLESLKDMYRKGNGLVSKEDFAAALFGDTRLPWMRQKVPREEAELLYARHK